MEEAKAEPSSGQGTVQGCMGGLSGPCCFPASGDLSPLLSHPKWVPAIFPTHFPGDFPPFIPFPFLGSSRTDNRGGWEKAGPMQLDDGPQPD